MFLMFLLNLWLAPDWKQDKEKCIWLNNSKEKKKKKVQQAKAEARSGLALCTSYLTVI